MARPQLPQETQKIIAQLHLDGLPVGTIAKRLKCSVTAVRNALERRGLEPRRYPRKALKIAGIPVYAIKQAQEDWRNAPDGEGQEAVVRRLQNTYRISLKSAVRVVYGNPPYVITPEILEDLAAEQARMERGQMSQAHREDLEALLETLQEGTKGHRGPLADFNREIIESIRETLAKDALEDIK